MISFKSLKRPPFIVAIYCIATINAFNKRTPSTNVQSNRPSERKKECDLANSFFVLALLKSSSYDMSNSTSFAPHPVVLLLQRTRL